MITIAKWEHSGTNTIIVMTWTILGYGEIVQLLGGVLLMQSIRPVLSTHKEWVGLTTPLTLTLEDPSPSSGLHRHLDSWARTHTETQTDISLKIKK